MLTADGTADPLQGGKSTMLVRAWEAPDSSAWGVMPPGSRHPSAAQVLPDSNSVVTWSGDDVELIGEQWNVHSWYVPELQEHGQAQCQCYCNRSTLAWANDIIYTYYRHPDHLSLITRCSVLGPWQFWQFRWQSWQERVFSCVTVWWSLVVRLGPASFEMARRRCKCW